MARPSLNHEERSARRRVLLDAAHRLFHQQGALPTVADIAQAAGMAKGSVYLSFASKEEIFIALLEDGFEQLLAGLAPVLHELPRKADQAAARFASVFTQALAQVPDLLPLSGMMHAVLEKNLPLAGMLAFKQNLAQGLQRAGAALETLLPELAAGAGADLLLRTWALTMGLWQTLDCPSALRPFLAQPELRVLDRQFETELPIAVHQLWRGALG